MEIGKMVDYGLRPHFHITGKTGWINDPNGLIFFKGKYHAFYQYYPHATSWGPMHWGHSISDDLVHWEYLPIALYPGDEYDKDGCFSGSAIEHDGEIYVMYTGFCDNGGGENSRQVQCLAKSSDGISFNKLGVVISSEELPVGYNPCDFRDPKVWLHEGVFYAIIAAKITNGRGRILMYSSNNLLKWEFVGDLFGVDSEGGMIECPDYIPSLGLLMFSEQFSKRKDYLHTNIHSNHYCIGKMDYKNGRFITDNTGLIDYGFDFYAAQSFSGTDRAVIMAWMNMWDRDIPSSEHGFAGMMTLPRLLEINDGNLIQSPALGKLTLVEKRVLSDLPEVLFDNALNGVLTIDASNTTNLTINLRAGDGQKTTLYIKNNSLVFDRSQSGAIIKGAENDPYSEMSQRVMPLDNPKDISICIVMDRFSLEVFCEGKVLTSSVFPNPNSDGIEISADAQVLEYRRFEITK